jgi:putative inorganic carbon (hco3(-)) transporter
MPNAVSKANEKPPRPVAPQSFRRWLAEQVFVHKLRTLPGIVGLIGLACLLAVVGTLTPPRFGFYLFSSVILVPCLIASVFHLRFGIFLLLFVSFFLLGIKRILGDPPIGVYLDISVVLMLLGLGIRMGRDGYLPRLTHPVTWLILLWMGYNFLQVGNPDAVSQKAWLYTFRSTAGMMAIYFVALYAFEKLEDLKQLLILWIGLSALAAGYGLFQELWGFQGFELEWISRDPEYYRLMQDWDRFRIFSFLSDPAVFGVLMATTSLLCLILLLTFSLEKWEMLSLLVVLALCVPAMIFAGTRTAFVLIPAGLFFFALLTLNRRVLKIVALIALAGIGLVALPVDNAHAVRMRSAFQPWNLDSYQVREQTWEEIQPFIRSKPIGAGLGTTGVYAQRFTPHTLLAQFPPDNGYVRMAVEEGWVGLLLFLSLMFAVMASGVRGYFRSTQIRTRAYYPVFLTLILMLIIAHFPQQAITQVPMSLFFYVSMAIVVKLKDMELKDSGFSFTQIR